MFGHKNKIKIKTATKTIKSSKWPYNVDGFGSYTRVLTGNRERERAIAIETEQNEKREKKHISHSLSLDIN